MPENSIKSIRPTPGLIPHELFHKGSWLLPSINENWYYFAILPEKLDTREKKPNHSNLDNNVKPIVDFLQQKGIRTTPSCQGHFYKNSNFAEIYDSLIRDSEFIKNEGLVFKDEETGKFYNFRKSDYRLPWTKEDFIKQASEYQKKGVIGIVDVDRQEELESIMLPGVHVKTDEDVTIFITKASNEKQVGEIWASLLEALRKIYR